MKKEILIKKAKGKSQRDLSQILAEINPSDVIEKARPIGKSKIELKIVIDENTHKNLEKLKHLLSHKNPNMSYGELISILSEIGINKYDPRRRVIKKIETSTRKRAI